MDIDTMTVEQLNLISIYDTGDRRQLIADLESRIPYVEDGEMQSLMSGALKALWTMTDEEYASIVIICTTDEEMEDEFGE